MLPSSTADDIHKKFKAQFNPSAFNDENMTQERRDLLVLLAEIRTRWLAVREEVNQRKKQEKLDRKKKAKLEGSADAEGKTGADSGLLVGGGGMEGDIAMTSSSSSSSSSQSSSSS